jgi:hypothetical protein
MSRLHWIVRRNGHLLLLTEFKDLYQRLHPAIVQVMNELELQATMWIDQKAVAPRGSASAV